MNERTDLVEFYCVAHRDGGGAEGLLTLNEGRWAFCPRGDEGDDHRWRRIEPIELSALRALGKPTFVVTGSEASAA